VAPDVPLPEPDPLDRLVTLLDAACRDDGWHQPHRLVSLEPAPTEDEPDAIAFGFRVLAEGEHPLDHLLGFVAPPSWTGLGVVCFGWAAPAPPDISRGTVAEDDRPSRHPDRRRVRVVTIVDRSGREEATASLDDGTVIDEPGSGIVSDAVRRALAIATPPPPVSTGELFAARWLEAIAAAGRALTWPEAAVLHPALQVLRESGRRPQPEELIGCGRSLQRTVPWEDLRRRAAEGRADALGVPAELAAWMDDGMFARWALARVPTLPSLLQACAGTVSPAVLQRVRRALRAWNLDPPLPAPSRS
jgi:hypothetical protein